MKKTSPAPGPINFVAAAIARYTRRRRIYHRVVTDDRLSTRLDSDTSFSNGNAIINAVRISHGPDRG